MGYSFGWGPEVDKITMGLEPENLVIFGGSNKGGKTTFAVNTVAECCLAGVPVLVITSEVSASQYLLRLALRYRKFSRRQLMEGELNQSERERLMAAVMLYGSDQSLTVLDRPYATVQEIEQAIKEREPKVVVVDHLQRLDLGRGDNLAIGIKFASLRFKNLAVKKECAILALSQTSHMGQWYEQNEETGEITYNLAAMSTRWGKEPLGEGDKILFLHNLSRDLWGDQYRDKANIIVHSQRDYESGDIIPVRTRLAHQWVGGEEEYQAHYGNRIRSGVSGDRGCVLGRESVGDSTGADPSAAAGLDGLGSNSLGPGNALHVDPLHRGLPQVSAEQELSLGLPSRSQGSGVLEATGVLGLPNPWE